jgi:hypothetical protein
MPFRLIDFPVFNPVALALGPIVIRWYALAYIVGIVLGWIYARSLIKKERLWGGGVMRLAEAHLQIHRQGDRHDGARVKRNGPAPVAPRPGEAFRRQRMPESRPPVDRVDDQHANDRPCLVEECGLFDARPEIADRAGQPVAEPATPPNGIGSGCSHSIAATWSEAQRKRMAEAARIRGYRSSDAYEVNRLAVAAFEQFRDAFDDWPAMRAGLSKTSELSSGGVIIVAELGDRLAGAVGYHRRRSCGNLECARPPPSVFFGPQTRLRR